ncbi:hypothetical protein [Rhizobium sp. 18055]|uniref:hypothetical protein n=1 Tax=Rhizobium sp. 18055 TaxID=2681403 RepID=UPI001359A2D9|nr:hypothetical protein [Rhizobium sp. 18055]
MAHDNGLSVWRPDRQGFRLSLAAPSKSLILAVTAGVRRDQVFEQKWLFFSLLMRHGRISAMNTQTGWREVPVVNSSQRPIA